MSTGQKHLVKCRCILPQFKRHPNPPHHRFVAFSVVNDDDTVVTKFVQCNNCGTIHKVVGLCQSEIMLGKEHMRSITTLDEVKAGLPDKLVAILDSNHADQASYEMASFIIENERWGDSVTLMTDEEAGIRQVKYVRILAAGLFKVDKHTNDALIGDEDA